MDLRLSFANSADDLFSDVTRRLLRFFLKTLTASFKFCSSISTSEFKSKSLSSSSSLSIDSAVSAFDKPVAAASSSEDDLTSPNLETF